MTSPVFPEYPCQHGHLPILAGSGKLGSSYRIARTGFRVVASRRRVPLATHGSGWAGPQGNRRLPAA
jgi:hypothetical protein